MSVTLYHGDCVAVMRGMADNSVDAIVTDPPAGIAFMGKAWDSDRGGRRQWIAWLAEVMTEAHRVLKPGGHALVWALPRTSHWTATALEDAGFEVRDRIAHHFGSGMPKSPSVLKPATEDWWLARKPLSEPTVAANVLRHGTGALNVDACRIGTTRDVPASHSRTESTIGVIGIGNRRCPDELNPNIGRWPANVIFSHSLFCTADACHESCPVALLDRQSGVRKSGEKRPRTAPMQNGVYGRYRQDQVNYFPASEGTASRFFYVSKASRRERGEGNGHPTVKPLVLMRYLCRLITPPGGIVLDPFAGSGTTGLAALAEGFGCVLIEQEAEHVAIIRRRLGLPDPVEQAAD
jgi:hypothetical protein